MDLRKHVAISEETPYTPADSAKSGGLKCDRKVERVVTAGTLIDEDFLDPEKNNYLLCIHVDHWSAQARLGLAWLDLSSSSFFVQSIEAAALPSALERIAPSEVVLDRTLEAAHEAEITKFIRDARYPITYHDFHDIEPSSETWSNALERPLPPGEAEKFSPEETAAASLALHYVQNRLQSSDIRLQPPIRQDASNLMIIDKYSIKALEMIKTLRDGLHKGSLLHVLQNTVTRSGSRLLANRLRMKKADIS
jgi:DNA mismatch repair ATPase MutS